jgi:chromosomal replication initiator protein
MIKTTINVDIHYKRSAQNQIISFINLINRKGNKINVKFVNKDNENNVEIAIIQHTVEKYFNLERGDINKNVQLREIVLPRQIAMFFAKELTSCSLYEIGSQLAFRDHATVISAVKTVSNLIQTDRKFRDDIEKIRKLLK